MLVVAVIILAGVVVVASGRGGEMAPEYPDYPRIDLGPVTAADVVMMRPPSAAWGYNMRITDEALEAIARAVTERDVRISALEQEVSDLRGQAGEHPLEAQPAIRTRRPGRPRARRTRRPDRPRARRTRRPDRPRARTPPRRAPCATGRPPGSPGRRGLPTVRPCPGRRSPTGRPPMKSPRTRPPATRMPGPGNRPTRRPPTASPRTRPSVTRTPRTGARPPRGRPGSGLGHESGTCRGRRRLSRRSGARPGRMSRPRAMTWTTVARDR